MRTSIDIPDKEWEWAKAEAVRRRSSLSSVISAAIRQCANRSQFPLVHFKFEADGSPVLDDRGNLVTVDAEVKSELPKVLPRK